MMLAAKRLLVTRRDLVRGAATFAGALALGTLAGCAAGDEPSSADSAGTDDAMQPDQDARAGSAVNAEYGIYRTEEERMAASASLNDVKPEAKTVYLTFDDGPSDNCQRILDILDGYGVKATWFVKGSCGRPDYIPTIWDDGNQIGIHTYSHVYEEVYASADAYWADMDACADVIEGYIGFRPTILRFPGSSVNAYNQGVRDELFAQIEQRGYHYFDWNVSSGDGATCTTEEIVGNITGGADGCHSCCVLMHDSNAKDTTVEGLPSAIEWFIANGFVFDVITSDTYGYHF